MPGTRPQPQPGKWGKQTRLTPTPRPPTRNIQPKMAGPPKCKLRASIGTCATRRQTSQDPLGQPGSQADPAMHHPAHYHTQGKDTSPNKKGDKERPQHVQQRGYTPPEDAESPTSMPAKQKRQSQAKLRGTVKTTNPKHTPPTRNDPADKQTPPQHKAEKPDVTTEPSDARPAIQNTEARAGMPRTTTLTPQHAKQLRTERSNKHPKQKPYTKPTKYNSPTRKPTPKPTKGIEPKEPKPKPTKKPRPVHPRSATASPPTKPCRPLQPPSPRQDRHQEPEVTRIRTGNTQVQTMPIPTQGKSPTSIPEENYHPPQHPNISQNILPETLDTQVDSAPPPLIDPPPHQQSALLEGESRCRVPEHVLAQNPSDIPAQTQAPPWPARTTAQGRHTPGTQSTQAHPRSAQEQPDHQARNLCPPVQASQKHRMQPPDATPESHQSPIPVGPQPLTPDPPETPVQGHPKFPKPRHHPRIRHNAPQDEAKDAPPPLGDGAD
ncbi:extensin-like [Girardinichthys multiradiatus]|uniref:extensin-like n=1 Tax=Girardinichthys multiradiatus TaxID=208333 RepID=UPI001FAE1FA8|nr:extensin-like [Girardinichthys multiradiatus]